MAPKVAQVVQNVMSNFDLKFDVRFFGLGPQSGILRWRSWTAQYSCSAGKLEELEAISYAMHHGNDAADPMAFGQLRHRAWAWFLFPMCLLYA